MMDINSSPKRNTNFINHKNLYKSPCNAAGLTMDCGADGSPTWRNAYKRRCFDEFKKSRQKLLSKFRNFNIEDEKSGGKKEKLRDFLNEELEKICLLEADKNLITIDEAINLYKEVQSEMLNQEYEDFEEAWLLSSQANDSVVCPMCQRTKLNEDNYNRVINCGNCGFKISTAQKKLTLAELAFKLQNAVAQHECAEVPYFQYCAESNEVDLIMVCDKCSFMHCIL